MRAYTTQIAVIGSGPAGLAAAATLSEAGWRVVVLEKGVFAAGIARFPIGMRFFSTADLIELCGFPLTIPDAKPTREQYLRYLQRFAAHFRLEVHPRHEVRAIEGQDGRFLVSGQTAVGEPFEVLCEKVVLATGVYDHPNLLGVPGEDLPKVSHYYREANDHIGLKTLIVGGRHSASEAALDLARAGVDVTLVHRGPAFRDLKYWIGPDLENRINEGRIKAYLNTRVLEIRPQSVVLRTGTGEPFEIANDSVLALTGYRPDPAFLTQLGLALDPDHGSPLYDPRTLESSRPGVYLAGVLLAGDAGGAIFIENSRTHGERILAHLGRSRGAARVGWR